MALHLIFILDTGSHPLIIFDRKLPHSGTIPLFRLRSRHSKYLIIQQQIYAHAKLNASTPLIRTQDYIINGNNTRTSLI